MESPHVGRRKKHAHAHGHTHTHHLQLSNPKGRVRKPLGRNLSNVSLNSSDPKPVGYEIGEAEANVPRAKIRWLLGPPKILSRSSSGQGSPVEGPWVRRVVHKLSAMFELPLCVEPFTAQFAPLCRAPSTRRFSRANFAEGRLLRPRDYVAQQRSHLLALSSRHPGRMRRSLTFSCPPLSSRALSEKLLFYSKLYSQLWLPGIVTVFLQP